MPRDGSGNYSLPGGFDAVKGEALQPVESTPYNSVILDLQSDANIPRPIPAGGTGATTPASARAALGAEVAAETVTNFDSHAFKAGSFTASGSATGTPVLGQSFSGICIPMGGGDFTLLVYSRDDGKSYTRRTVGGVWQAWVLDPSDAGAFVLKAGDTMSGDLIISKASPAIVLNKAAAGQPTLIDGKLGDVMRWRLSLGDGAAESGSNAGSRLVVLRYSDAGAVLGTPIIVNRDTGVMTLEASPVAPTPPAGTNNTQLATTAFVRSESGLVLLNAQEASGSSAIAFTSLLNTDYEKYVVEIVDVKPNTDNVSLLMEFSHDNGASWAVTNYATFTYFATSAANTVSGTNNTGTAAAVQVGGNLLGTGAGRAAQVTVDIPNPAVSGKEPMIGFRAFGFNHAGAYYYAMGGGCRTPASGVVLNAVRFRFSSGNIASGKFKLYGMKK